MGFLFSCVGPKWRAERFLVLMGWTTMVLVAGTAPASAQHPVTEQRFRVEAGDRPGEGLLARAVRQEAARLAQSPVPDPTAPAATQRSGMWPASALTVGSRVRVRLSAALGRVAGTLAGLDGQVLALNAESGPLRIPVSSIQDLELSLGRQRQWLKGMVAGAAAGLGAGFLYPVDSSECDMDSTNFCSRSAAVASVTVAYGLMGAGVGAFVKRERWMPVDTSSLGQVNIAEAQQPANSDGVPARTPSAPAVTISGGLAVASFGPGDNGAGFFLEGERALTRRLGLVGTLDRTTGTAVSRFGSTTKWEDVSGGGGVRFRWRAGSTTRPFVHLLLTSYHSAGVTTTPRFQTTRNSETVAAALLGGGFDLVPSPRLGLRLGLDGRLSDYGGVRATFGVVVPIGTP